MTVCAWQDVPREGGDSIARQPLVTLRPSGVAFNSHFVRLADLRHQSFVSLKVDPESLRIGMRFHNDQHDPTALTVTHDGGGGGHRRRERNNLMVNTAALMTRHKWVMAAAREPDLTLRRFVPEWMPREQMWVISLRPSFEMHARAKEDVPATACGIYRYVDREEIVYIGKGRICDRMQSPERDTWQWDRIEYSVISDDSQQFRWEAWWLEWFQTKHGSLPRYNRIGGVGGTRS